MTRIIGLDPGPEESGIVRLHYETMIVEMHSVIGNHSLRLVLAETAAKVDLITIEAPEFQGGKHRAGNKVFDTAIWVGRFQEICITHGGTSKTYKRGEIKQKIAGNRNMTSSDVRRALIHLFGPSDEQAIGNIRNPGPLYGVSTHEWQALAVALLGARELVRGQ